MRLNIIVKSTLNSDGFDTVVTDDEDSIMEKQSWNYEYDCSMDKRFASEDKPYVPEILQKLIDKHRINEVTVEAGENVFAREEVTTRKVENFRNSYCRDLQTYSRMDQEEQDFANAVSNISGSKEQMIK